MLVLTLLFLGVVGLRRTWDLRGYTGDALALLSGRKRYTFPVSYIPDGETLLVISQKDRIWWKNLRKGTLCKPEGKRLRIPKWRQKSCS